MATSLTHILMLSKGYQMFCKSQEKEQFGLKLMFLLFLFLGIVDFCSNYLNHLGVTFL